jgi:hypothetical protein
MTKLARFLSLLAGASIGLWVAPAAAQTISLPNTAFSIERENPRSEDERPLDISRQDCLDSATFGWDSSRGTEKSERDGNTWIVMEPQLTGLAGGDGASQPATAPASAAKRHRRAAVRRIGLKGWA